MNSGIPFIKIADRVRWMSTSRRSRSAGLSWSTSSSSATKDSLTLSEVRLKEFAHSDIFVFSSLLR